MARMRAKWRRNLECTLEVSIQGFCSVTFTYFHERREKIPVRKVREKTGLVCARDYCKCDLNRFLTNFHCYRLEDILHYQDCNSYVCARSLLWPLMRPQNP
jgi:hypothetical protein